MKYTTNVKLQSMEIKKKKKKSDFNQNYMEPIDHVLSDDNQS